MLYFSSGLGLVAIALDLEHHAAVELAVRSGDVEELPELVRRLDGSGLADAVDAVTHEDHRVDLVAAAMAVQLNCDLAHRFLGRDPLEVVTDSCGTGLSGTCQLEHIYPLVDGRLDSDTMMHKYRYVNMFYISE